MKKPEKLKELDEGQLELMWKFLMMGSQKSNIPILKEYLNQLRMGMAQKTAGNYLKPGTTDFNDIGTIVNAIVIETMCLYLSGDLDKLEKLIETERGETDGT